MCFYSYHRSNWRYFLLLWSFSFTNHLRTRVKRLSTKCLSGRLRRLITRTCVIEDSCIGVCSLSTRQTLEKSSWRRNHQLLLIRIEWTEDHSTNSCFIQEHLVVYIIRILRYVQFFYNWAFYLFEKDAWLSSYWSPIIIIVTVIAVAVAVIIIIIVMVITLIDVHPKR